MSQTEIFIAANIAAFKSFDTAERQLDKLSRVVEQTSDIVLITDKDGTIEYVNPSFERLTGYGKEECLGLKPNILKSGQHSKTFYGDLWNTILSGDIFRSTVVNRKKNGDLYFSEKIITPLRDKENKISHFVSTDRDVTERMESQKALASKAEELQRSNEELTQFAYVASHDLQEPLRMISTYLELIKSRYIDQLDGDADEFFGYAMDGAKRMRALIEDLLSYSRVGRNADALEPVDCNDVVQRAIGNLGQAISERNANICVQSLPQVHGRQIQLVQVFQNLIGNAIKYCVRSKPEIEIGVEELPTEWRFHVKDNGIGIPQGKLQEIFSIFQRLHSRQAYPGTGIGLAICKKIVERNGGSIWAESDMGKGSVFYFTLPFQNKSGVPVGEPHLT